MMRFRSALALLLGCLAAAPAAWSEEVWRRVDKDGSVHYRDTPQPGWEKVAVEAPATAELEPPEPGSPEALRAEQCTAKKQQLETYRNATTIKERDPLGREKEYSAAERVQLLEITQKQIDETCSPLVVTPEDTEETTPVPSEEQAQAGEEDVPEVMPGSIR